MWKTIDLAPKDGTVILTEQGSVCYVDQKTWIHPVKNGWYLCALHGQPELEDDYSYELNPKYWYDGITDVMSVKDIEEYCKQENPLLVALKEMISLFNSEDGAVWQWCNAPTSLIANKIFGKISGILSSAKSLVNKLENSK